jgi:hypothetical protein
MAARHPNPDAKNGGTHVAPQPLNLAFGRFAAPELLSRKGQPGVDTTSFDARKGPFFFWYAGQNVIRPSRILARLASGSPYLFFEASKTGRFCHSFQGRIYSGPKNKYRSTPHL